MNKNKILLSVLSVFVSACVSSAHSTPDKKWSIRISMPSFYPVNVTQAYGINEEQDWTSPIHNMITTMSTSRLSSVREWLPEYDGYGLPVNTFTTVWGRQIAGTNELPDSIVIAWVSLANTQFYVTQYNLADDIKKLSSTKVSYTRGDGFVVDSCYRTEFVFGLKPNGNAEVFLKGCGELIHIKELAPEIVMDKDSQGFGVEDYKKRSYLGRIQKRAEDAGAVLDPIPWDKVNKVYSNYEITELN